MTPKIWIKSGKLVDPFNLKPEDINIRDIAHSLAGKGRYGDHTSDAIGNPRSYSVAQHCVVLTMYAATRGFSWNEIRWALLHDAHEAYFSDILRPVYHSYPVFREAEERIAKPVREALGLIGEMPERVKHIDTHACWHEMQVVFNPAPSVEDLKEWGLEPLEGFPIINPTSAVAAKQAFLSIYEMYCV